MALIRRYTTASISYKTTGAPASSPSRSDFLVSMENTPAKVSGSWIVFPDGSRFRTATNRSLSRCWIEPGAPQRTSGTRYFLGVNERVFANSSPGGYRGDFAIGFTSDPAFAEATVGLTSPSQVPFIPTGRRNEAVTKALLSIADAKVGMGENLGTLGQTIRMIHSPASALISSLRECHSRKSLKPFLGMSIASIRRKGISGWAADRYLEYVYGWKPLVQDIYGLIDLAKQAGDSPLLLRGTGTSKVHVQHKDWTYSEPSSNTTTNVTSHMMDSRVACTLWARIDPNWKGTRALNQLGLANPLALAWELASFSFVVDWLLPIGPVLNALSAPAGLAFINGSISNRVSTDAQYEHWYKAIDVWASSNSHANGRIRYEGYTRHTLTGWPLPGFWFDPDPLKSDRPLKALALLWSRLSSLR